jgi:hypothetical protein
MTTTTGSRLEHTIGAEGLLAISLPAGDIRLRAIDGDAVLVRELGGQELDDTFTVELGEGSLALRASRGSDLLGRRGHRRSADLEVELPRRATVVVEGASAEIEADGLLGDQRYRTASGDVTLRAVSGRIAVETASGDVDIVAIGTASVTARIVSGDLALRAATLTMLAVTTTSGDLKVAGSFAGQGPFGIQTVSGDALLAPAGDVRIEMTTVAGDLHSEIGGWSEGRRGRRSLVIGSGPLVTFRSMSGDLRVVRPTSVEVPAGAVEALRVPVPAVVPAVVPVPEPILAQDRPPLQGAVDRDDTERIPTPTPRRDDPGAPSPAIATAHDDARLRILRSLESGEIDVAEAGRRLEALDGGESGDPAEAAGAAGHDAHA